MKSAVYFLFCLFLASCSHGIRFNTDGTLIGIGKASQDVATSGKTCFAFRQGNFAVIIGIQKKRIGEPAMKPGIIHLCQESLVGVVGDAGDCGHVRRELNRRASASGIALGHPLLSTAVANSQ